MTTKAKWLKKVDHITYAVSDIRKWAWYHIEIEGGELINRIDDVMPDNPDFAYHIDIIGSGSEEDMSLYLRYYADDETYSDVEAPPGLVAEYERRIAAIRARLV